MSIKFLNIRSREVVVAENEPQISALWSSSDHSPNITQGQDFGWRLAPEVVVQMKRILRDKPKMTEIAHIYNMMLEDVGEVEVLQYISDMTAPQNAPVADLGDYTDEYYAEIKQQEKEAEKADQAAPTTTQTTTESLADLERRVELQERLARAQAAAAPAEVQTATTTTTQRPTPTVTTTTTKKQ